MLDISPMGGKLKIREKCDVSKSDSFGGTKWLYRSNVMQTEALNTSL